MNTIKMTVQNLEKKGKVTYKVINEEVKYINNEQYNNITSSETLKWFRRLGGSETVTRAYTSQGYKVVNLISTSPDKENKTVRTFKIN